MLPRVAEEEEEGVAVLGSSLLDPVVVVLQRVTATWTASSAATPWRRRPSPAGGVEVVSGSGRSREGEEGEVAAAEEGKEVARVLGKRGPVAAAL